MNNIASAFLETATPHADKPALFWGDSRFTYGHYRDQVLGTAAMLRARGIRPGDRVAVWLKNCPEFVGALFGVLAADAVLVPINNFLKPAEVAYMLQDAGIDWIIAEEGHAGLPELRTLRPGLQVLSRQDVLPLPPRHRPCGTVVELVTVGRQHQGQMRMHLPGHGHQTHLTAPCRWGWRKAGAAAAAPGRRVIPGAGCR